MTDLFGKEDGYRNCEFYNKNRYNGKVDFLGGDLICSNLSCVSIDGKFNYECNGPNFGYCKTNGISPDKAEVLEGLVEVVLSKNY